MLDDVALPPQAVGHLSNVKFTAKRELPYFPIPLKETEVTAALKAIEGRNILSLWCSNIDQR